MINSRKVLKAKDPSMSDSPIWVVPIPQRLMGVLCLAVVVATLIAGLWPFTAPKNEVTWLKDGEGVRFGEHGTALSSTELSLASSAKRSCTLELWVQRERIWTRGTVLAIYNSSDHRQFAVQQDLADLVLQLGSGLQPLSEGLRVRGVFRKPDTLIAVSSDGRTASIYVNGELVLASSNFSLTGKDLSGQVILANSPVLDSSWSGQVKGLAIYDRARSAEQVLRDYQNWTNVRDLVPEEDQQAIALYRFREGAGSVIRSPTPTGPDLEIPQRFRVMDQIRFESPVTEFLTEGNYWDNVQINIIGFVPLGFVLATYFATVLNMKRAAVAAVVGGMAVSFAIEYLQSFLPTRYSGWTDIFTNTLGTAVGVLIYRMTARFVSFRSPEHASQDVI